MTDLPEPHYYQTTEADGRCTFNPYYTATQMREYRNQALEEAAKVCDSKSQEYLERNVRNQHSHGAGLGATICAEAIRALKERL